MAEILRFVVRTPHDIVVDERILAARLPTETGQVGLRPRQEPFLTAVEPGLCLLRLDTGTRFVATAGGLLEGNRAAAVLYTAFAVAGTGDTEVLAALDRALATPDGELAARRRLGELEQHIAHELRSRPSTVRTRTSDD